MHIKSITLFGLLALTAGCNNMHRDLPHPLITQEQDTPFIFKERYQVEPVSTTHALIEHQSDFVVIQSTDEFVFWHPKASTAFLVDASTDNTQEAPVSSDEPSKSSSVPESLAPAASSAENLDTSMTDDVESLQCLPVLYEGKDSGAIAVCNGQPCDESLMDKYTCNERGCELLATPPFEVAKSNDCKGFEQLDTCPSQTECKKRRLQAMGVTL